MVDPDESVAQSRYNEAQVEQLIAQFDRRIQRLAGAIHALDDEAADRTLTMDGRQIYVALVARSAWHEGHHHLRDIQRLGG
jgi:protein-disulfide isomerase-like protein with CxxC motif